MTSDECYCCTCGPYPDWDPACRLHGAHGLRPCNQHNKQGVPCDADCGCGGYDPRQEPAS